MDMGTRNQQTVQCEVLTASGKSLKTLLVIVTKNQETVLCEVLTDGGQTVEDRGGHRVTQKTVGTV
jgi:hypothetical protein